MKDTCSACGIPWTDHPGIQPTCQKLLEALANNEELKERLMRAQDEISELKADIISLEAAHDDDLRSIKG